MRTTSIVAAAAFASMMLAAASAFAGEGNGDPFPFHAQFAPTQVGQVTADTGSAGYPAFAQAYATTGLSQETLPEVGVEGAVQAVNSVPRNFDVGTVQYAEAQATNRWFAEQAAHRFARLQGQTAPRG